MFYVAMPRHEPCQHSIPAKMVCPVPGHASVVLHHFVTKSEPVPCSAHGAGSHLLGSPAVQPRAAGLPAERRVLQRARDLAPQPGPHPLHARCPVHVGTCAASLHAGRPPLPSGGFHQCSSNLQPVGLLVGCRSTACFRGLVTTLHAANVAAGCLVAKHIGPTKPSLAAQLPPWHPANSLLLWSTEPTCDAQPLACWSAGQHQNFRETLCFYEPIVRAHSDDLLSVAAIVLANLCVSYIMTSQNEDAEALMRKVEQEEELQAQRVRGPSGGRSARQLAGRRESDWWQPQHVQLGMLASWCWVCCKASNLRMAYAGGLRRLATCPQRRHSWASMRPAAGCGHACRTAAGAVHAVCKRRIHCCNGSDSLWQNLGQFRPLA